MQRAKAVGSGSSVMGRSFVGSPAGWAMKAGSIANARSSRNLSEAEAATVFRGRDRNRFRGRIPSSDSESEFRIRKFGYRYGHVRPPRATRRSAFQRRPASLEASEALSGVTYVAGRNVSLPMFPVRTTGLGDPATDTVHGCGHGHGQFRDRPRGGDTNRRCERSERARELRRPAPGRCAIEPAARDTMHPRDSRSNRRCCQNFSAAPSITCVELKSL